MFTPRDELDRVPTFEEQERRRREARTPPAEDQHEPRLCDSCRTVIDPVAEPNRYRHRDCPPPPLPRAAREALARLRAPDAAA